MATAVQRRKGTTVEHLTFTGLEAEITIDTDKETAVVHDGGTAGGFTLLREDMANYNGSVIDNFRSKGIDDNTVAPSALLALHDNGSKFGSPTGGDGDNVMGPGTINTQGVYVNGGAILGEATNANVTADWMFSGNISFTGDVTNASSTNTNVKDNLIILNDEETTNGVAGGAGTAGLQVDRGYTSNVVATTGDLTFANANPDTIVRASGNWTTDGVIVGSFVSVAGSTQNDGVFLVASVTTTSTTDDTIVLDAAENLVADGPETVTTVTVHNTANTKASLIFNEADDTWKLGLVGSESAIITGASPSNLISLGDTSVVITDTGVDGTITMSTDGAPALTLASDQSSTFAGVMNVTNDVNFVFNSTENLFIDGTATPRDITQGCIRIEHTPNIVGTRGIDFEVDADGFDDTMAMVVNYRATGLAAGNIGMALEINIDTADATGGEIDGLRISKTGEGVIDAVAFATDVGVGVVRQVAGTFVSTEQGFYNDGSFTDLTSPTDYLTSTGDNFTLFSTNLDYLYIGMANQFDQLNTTLVTSGNKTIKPVFEYSDGIGGWTTFSANDNTAGFTSSGIISWQASALSGWAQDTVNAIGSKYWIRIQRTQNGSISIKPIESSILTSSVNRYSWDENGNVIIKNITAVDGTFSGDLLNSLATTDTVLSGGTTNVLGGNLKLFGESHATKADTLEFYNSNNLALTLDGNQNVVIGSGELADAATDGFFYLPTTTAGIPTGTPTAHSGRVPMVYDNTNSALYVYNGSWQPAGAADGDGLAYAIAFS